MGSVLGPPGLLFGLPSGPGQFETSLLGALGPAKSRSRLVFFGPRAAQERSKRVPRPLPEAFMRPRRPKKAPGGLWGPLLVTTQAGIQAEPTHVSSPTYSLIQELDMISFEKSSFHQMVAFGFVL